MVLPKYFSMFVTVFVKCKSTKTMPQNNKGMKSIIVQPVNKSIKISIESILVKNEFIKMGFKSGGILFLILKHSFPDISKKYTNDQIVSYWNLRLKSEEMNNDFLKVIEVLKAE